MNLVKLRSSTGRSVICLESKLVETSARSVFSSGDPPVTSTCSVRSPSSQLEVDGSLRVDADAHFTQDGGLEAGSSALTS